MNKMLRINMTTLKCESTVIADKYRLLGGRGLTSRIIADEVEPCCEALGPQNIIVIAPGLLGGTNAPCSGRLSIGAKSPLTGGIKESNVGGKFAQIEAQLGIKAIIIEGACENNDSYILYIDDEGCKLINADEYKGIGNYETTARLIQEFGSETGILSVGPAGEHGYSIATIASTNMEGLPSRHAARGGMGSVMSSKGIKAVVIKGGDKTKNNRFENYDSFRNVAREWSKEIIPAKKTLTQIGTANLVSVVNELGLLPTRNFSAGCFESAEEISGEKLAELIKQRGGKSGHPCHPGCVIRCSNVFNNEDGQYVTSALEYETIVLNGSNLGLSSLDDIAEIDRFCDDFGIDTMDTGVTLGVAAEAGLAKFGDYDSFKKLLYQMKEKTTLGRVLGQGAKVTGRVFGVQRVPEVKGQGLSAYDPRGLKGTAVSYMTTPMGADHTAGNVLPGRGGFRPETQKGVPFDSDDAMQVQVSRDIQIMTTVCDLAGLCFFVGTTMDNMKIITQLVNFRYDTSLKAEELLDIALNTIKTEAEFNKKAGFTDANNRLPEFFMRETLEPKGYSFNVPQEEINNIWD